MNLTDIVIVFIIVLVVALLVKGMRNGKKVNTGEGAATDKQPSSVIEGDRQQIIEDIRATKTSRVVDQVAILEDLDATSPGYRQFCELVGTTQSSGGVTAPYSKRQVAYYDVCCYKVERMNGHDVETLVAQERSFEPFYFTDASCDTKVHLALDTFGKNVILVNSMNHIEGPKSDFSKAITNRTASLSGTGAAKFMVDDTSRNAREGFRHMRNVWSWTIVSPSHARQAMDAAWGFVGLRMKSAISSAESSVRAACAGIGSIFQGAGAYGMLPAYASAEGLVVDGPFASRSMMGRNAFFADGHGGKSGGKGKPSQGGYASRPPSSMGMGNDKPHKPTITVNTGSSGLPAGLDTFLGLGGTGIGGLQQNPYLGGPMSPYYGGYGTGKDQDLGSTLLSIGLGALLASISASNTSSYPPQTAQPTQTTPVYTQTNNTFMGYRIVEDVVPLNYPVYCLGEIYKNGQEVYMGKSIGKVSQSYYFATKLEAEVLAHLQS